MSSLMNFFRRKANNRPEATGATAKQPLYVGRIRAEHYAEALRDPEVRARLARVVAKTNATHPTRG